MEKCAPVQATGKRKKRKCGVCGKEYANVLRHQKTAHPVWFYANRHKNVNASTTEQKKHFCDVCDKKFFRPVQLLKHKQAIHKINVCSSDQNSSKQEKIKHFKCHVCLKPFLYNANLKRHLDVIHKIKTQYVKNLKCSECGLSFPSRVNFLDHIEKSHNISVITEKLHFGDVAEFEKWKAEVEKKTSSKFNKCKSFKLSSGKQTINFICHRNGIYKCMSTGKRRTKIAGTNKIESFCPSNIFVKSELTTTLFPADVTYCSVHLGHHCEIGQIPLTKDEKDELASHSESESESKFAIEIDDEKSAIIKELKRDTCKKSQDEAKSAVLGLLGKLERFSSEKQCKEIIRSISAITSKCEALEKSNECILHVQNPIVIRISHLNVDSLLKSETRNN